MAAAGLKAVESNSKFASTNSVKRVYIYYNITHITLLYYLDY